MILENLIAIIVMITSLLGLGFAIYLVFMIKKQSKGNKAMRNISKAIKEGANAFLFRQYRLANGRRTYQSSRLSDVKNLILKTVALKSVFRTVHYLNRDSTVCGAAFACE